MIKKLAIMLALVAGFAIADTPAANAWGYYRRVAPVRRVLAPPYPIARVVTPPYPVARAVVGPRYYARPYVTGYRGVGYYGGGPGVYIGF